MTRTESSQDTDGVPSEEDVPGVGRPYYSLIVPLSISAKVWSTLSASPSVVTAGEEEWQTLRIKQGMALAQNDQQLRWLWWIVSGDVSSPVVGGLFGRSSPAVIAQSVWVDTLCALLRLLVWGLAFFRSWLAGLKSGACVYVCCVCVCF